MKTTEKIENTRNTETSTLKLKLIEEELAGYVKADKKNWVRIYRLMSEVEEKELYKEREDTKSFTAWVNWIGDYLGVHVSLLWARLKAGRTYEEYEKRAAEQGRRVAQMEELDVSPESISLCEKVAGRNAEEMDNLIEKVVAGDLTREDLRDAAKAKRASGGTMPTSRHDRIDASERTEKAARVTAPDIVMALRKSSWLSVAREDEYFKHVYKAFTEFRIPSGTSRDVRRIDMMIVETLTTTEMDDIVLRGIEIKVDKTDLLKDHKMQEYTAFCDYFYIGIPAEDQEVLDTAESVRLPAWGILTVSKAGEITVVHEAKKLTPAFRDKTLATCIIKLA